MTNIKTVVVKYFNYQIISISVYQVLRYVMQSGKSWFQIALFVIQEITNKLRLLSQTSTAAKI